jgi:flagellar protein FlgJ
VSHEGAIVSEDNFIRSVSPEISNINFDQARNTLDLKGLNAIRQQARNEDGKEAALKEAAQQFEAIFMQMLLKSMRKAQDVLESDSPFNSQTSKSYRDMHDQQLALELSTNGSLGLTDLIVRQLGGNDGSFTSKEILRNDGHISAPINANQAMRIDNISAKRLEKSQENKVQADIDNLKDKRTTNALPPVSFDSPQDFVNSLTSAAKYVEKEIGIPYKVVIAQAALETGWGKKIIVNDSGNSSFNLFNIKADARWQGEKVDKNTLEFEQGTMVHKKEPFRLYQSFTESVNDYVNFLSSNDRYEKALNNPGNVEHFLQGIQEAGYATDPQYANKILSVLRKVTSLIEK